MKTPEEWADSFKQYGIDLFEAIQQDAWRQGMADAAAIATKQQNFEPDQTDRVITHNGTCNQIKNAIDAAIKEQVRQL